MPFATCFLEQRLRSCRGIHGIKGRRWFIENDQAQRDVGHREGPGNFRHLALAEGRSEMASLGD